jgi:hypothetical protein
MRAKAPREIFTATEELAIQSVASVWVENIITFGEKLASPNAFPKIEREDDPLLGAFRISNIFKEGVSKDNLDWRIDPYWRATDTIAPSNFPQNPTWLTLIATLESDFHE